MADATGKAREHNDRMLHRAVEVVEAARDRGVLVRLIGGCAILLRVAQVHDWLLSQGRIVRDIDFVCRRSDRQILPYIMAGLGYTEDARLNALHGRERNVFFGVEGSHAWEADFFFDRLPMCHVLDFSGRLELDPMTLAPVDLLLAKLQIVELNSKDALDITALLATHPVRHGEGSGLNLLRLAELTSNDWGLSHTVELNLGRVDTYLESGVVPEPWRDMASQRLGEVREAMERTPKSLRWKARARLGEKVRWYNLVEEARR